jgi:hypothetical protein
MNNRGKNKPGRVRERSSKDTRCSNPDEAVLNLMLELNVVQSGRRPVYFYLYFPSEQKAKIAEKELMDSGFSVECTGPFEDETDWLCLAEKNMLPALKELTPVRRKLEKLALKLNGKYDGWETEMLFDND